MCLSLHYINISESKWQADLEALKQSTENKIREITIEMKELGARKRELKEKEIDDLKE